MSNPFAYLWLFILSVGSHVVTLAAGCAVTVVIGIVEKHVLKRPISIKIEVGVFLFFVFFACFQTWRDEYEKSKLVTPNPPIQVNIPPITVPPAQVIVTPSQRDDASGLSASRRRGIQSKLSHFSDEGDRIRDAWKAAMGKPGDNQVPHAQKAREWHVRLERYLRAMPRGNTYLSRLNGAARTGSGGWPLGIDYKVSEDFDRLTSDLSMLNEFVKDSELGEP